MRSFPASNISLFVALMTSANSGQNPWGSGGAGGIGGLMLQAMNWWIEKCNDPSVGYSQDYRNERTVNGITYYDCSSFVWYGLGHAGYEINLSAWPFTTYTMGGILKSLGFEEIIITDFATFDFHVGDILVINSSEHQHTEIVHDLDNGGHTMGAHTSKNLCRIRLALINMIYKAVLITRIVIVGHFLVVTGSLEDQVNTLAIPPVNYVDTMKRQLIMLM